MKKKMLYTLIALLLCFFLWLARGLWVEAGSLPHGARRERCESSPNWRDGSFRNERPTPQLTGSDGMGRTLWRFLFSRPSSLTPGAALPVVRHNLHDLDRSTEVCVWLGHSTLFVQTAGLRFLFDPVLSARHLPVSLFLRPFKGSDVYTVADIPPVDYLVITHDHWDHLDYRTVRALQSRVSHVVCALGVGAHFEYWGYPAEMIHELDWGEAYGPLRCLPSRHFSGRLLGRNQSLWASFLIDGPRRIFVSGDGGYDERFARIGRQYPGIDLAVMENGQYNDNWRYIHTLPHQLPTAIDELGACRVLTYHNAKYALARHPWNEPLDSVSLYAKDKEWKLLTPRIGEPVRMDDDGQVFTPWWH